MHKDKDLERKKKREGERGNNEKEIQWERGRERAKGRKSEREIER